MEIHQSQVKASPKKMLLEFSNARTLKWIGVACVVHVIFFAAASANYLMGNSDSSSATPPAAASQPTTTASPTAATAPAGDKPAADKSVSDKPVADSDRRNDVPTPAQEADTLRERKESPVVKAITETAKPSEIPTSSSVNGID